MIDWRRHLVPRFSGRHFAHLVRITIVCTVLAGFYGAIHDQISYTISPEYFTKMKFQQFAWANFGGPPRLFAAVIGSLATWWLGMIGGWVLGRIGLAELREKTGRDYTLRAFALAIAIAAIIGFGGAMIGWFASRQDNLTAWQPWKIHLGLTDLPSFIVVAYLHWASYIGGVIGTVSAGIYVRRQTTRFHRRGSSA